MKKLNNKGMTVIELLLCFVLVSIISVSLYSTISSYNIKQNIESYKEKIYTFKNILTREIQNDIIKRGLIEAKITYPASTQTIVDMKFRDGSVRRLYILQVKARDYDFAGTCLSEALENDDKFVISYGDPQSGGIMEEYPLPDVGESENKCNKVVKDLRINNVKVNTKNNVLSVYIGFYHPDLSTRYAIDIVAPINYSPLSAGGSMATPNPW